MGKQQTLGSETTTAPIAHSERDPPGDSFVAMTAECGRSRHSQHPTVTDPDRHPRLCK